MPEPDDSLSPDEIIDFIETNYSDAQQTEIVKIFFRAGRTIYDCDLLQDLILKNVMCISSEPLISYRLDKYFDKHEFKNPTERKNFIFSKIPNLDGLNRGRAASYDDVVKFVSEKYPNLMLSVLSEILIYDFTPKFKANGRLCTLYFNRKHNPKANYKFDSKIGHYVLKEDNATNLLRSHGIKFEVENPDAMYSCVSLNETSNNKRTMPDFIKIILLIIFWPVGLYVLYKKFRRCD